MDLKLELVAIPVSDVDAAKDFYVNRIGFNADHDIEVSDEIRFVQLTPPGSACSIAIGRGITDAEPGSVEGMQVVVDNARALRDELVSKGVEATDVEEFPWGRFTFFSDPDGNKWAVQEVVAKPQPGNAGGLQPVSNEARSTSLSVSFAVSTSVRERIRSLIVSLTSQTFTFMPATTRSPFIQKAMNSRSSTLPR